MLIIPAIDIMSGKVVRLCKGLFEKATIYEASPLECVKRWQDEGAPWIHVVDLDGAKSGVLVNRELIERIIKNSRIPIEVGGGIRTAKDVRVYLDAGASRVVLSTKVMEDSSFLQQPLLKEYLKKIAVSIDIKQMQGPDVVTSGTAGWRPNGDILLDIPTFIKSISSLDLSYVNFSDISRDGMMAGLDIQKIVHFLESARKNAAQAMFFTYAGGISSIEDIKELRALGSGGVEAVIVGKALYENKFTLKEAIAAAS